MMKKSLLAVAVFAALSLSADAQRMTLHEEFTGENCPPCASTNPAFWTLCDAPGNPAKLIHISYMVPIPSAGWYCNRTSAIHTNRASYYSVPFAPYGRYDGFVPSPSCGTPAGSSAGHPGCFTQAEIDAEALVASPFTMAVSNAWNTNFDSIITTVTVTCVTNYSGTLFLRTALIHTDDFATSPGSNGETHFANVVQAMYPNATGTSMVGTWTAGMTNTYTITGAIPSWVDKSDAPYMVAWIQNDADKSIAQAGQAGPLPGIANDAAISGITAPTNIVCQANGPYSLAHSITLKNSGTSPLTSATIYYQIDGGTMLSTPWSGTLAPGATASVTMPVASITVSGALYHSIFDSVANPNGSPDKNVLNNPGYRSLFIESTTALPLPYTTSFETADAGKFDFLDPNSNGQAWGIFYSTSASLGHTGANAAKFDCYSFLAGESDIITLPEVTSTTGNKMEFYTAHASYTATAEDDKLEVVYSTDCGGNWTSIWSKSGSALINVTPTFTTSPFTPTATSYVKQTADLSTVPAGSIIGFRGTSAFGNNIWVDDVNIITTVNVNQVAQELPVVSVFPNPASETATLSLQLSEASEVQVRIVDGLGREMKVVANEKLQSGLHSFTINTSAFAAGVYNIMIHTENGTMTQRLTVAK